MPCCSRKYNDIFYPFTDHVPRNDKEGCTAPKQINQIMPQFEDAYGHMERIHDPVTIAMSSRYSLHPFDMSIPEGGDLAQRLSASGLKPSLLQYSTSCYSTHCIFLEYTIFLIVFIIQVYLNITGTIEPAIQLSCHYPWQMNVDKHVHGSCHCTHIRCTYCRSQAWRVRHFRSFKCI